MKIWTIAKDDDETGSMITGLVLLLVICALPFQVMHDLSFPSMKYYDNCNPYLRTSLFCLLSDIEKVTSYLVKPISQNSGAERTGKAPNKILHE